MAQLVQHQPICHAHDVQIGEIHIPVGSISTSQIYRKDFSGKDIHTVRVWTIGGMGLKNKGVCIDFQLETEERTNQFFKDLLEKTGASFTLYASLIKPDLEASGNQVKGIIDIHFQEDRYCEEFDSAIASTFFPGFKSQTLDGKILRLTSQEGTNEEITGLMNKAFAHLNAKTHLGTAELLYQNGDPRFYPQRRPTPSMATTCAPRHRDPYYIVALDGTVQKETAHIGAPPADHVKKWDESDFFYYAPTPLKQPTKEESAKIKATFDRGIEYAGKISAISGKMAQKMAPIIELLKVESEKKEPRNVVEMEVFSNVLDSFFSSKIEEHDERESAELKNVIEQLNKEIEEWEKEFAES